MTPRCVACMDSRGTVGRIYKEEYYALFCFYYFSHCKAMEGNEFQRGPIFDPRDMIGRIFLTNVLYIWIILVSVSTILLKIAKLQYFSLTLFARSKGPLKRL